MTEQLSHSFDNVDISYDNLIDIANDIIKQTTSNIDDIITDINDNIQNMNNDLIRHYMLQLSLQSYSFSEIKEKSAFKAELAETIKKEAYATKFNSLEGTVAVKQNNAELAVSNENLAEQLYTLIASLFKTKLDEVHRVVDTLKSVLMSRNAEAKMSNLDVC